MLWRRVFSFGASCRDVAPAGDLLFERPKRRQKVAPVPSPLRCAAGCPALLGGRGRAQLASFTTLTTLKQRGAKSDDEARCARAPAPCDARLLQRGVKEQPEQPTAQPERRSVVVFGVTPFSAAEQHRALRACAQRTSTSDSAQLFERSVAKRVLRGPSRTEQRREPVAKRRAARPGGAFCLLFGGTKSRSPAGAKTEGFAEGKSPRDAPSQTILPSATQHLPKPQMPSLN